MNPNWRTWEKCPVRTVILHGCGKGRYDTVRDEIQLDPAGSFGIDTGDFSEEFIRSSTSVEWVYFFLLYQREYSRMFRDQGKVDVHVRVVNMLWSRLTIQDREDILVIVTKSEVDCQPVFG